MSQIFTNTLINFISKFWAFISLYIFAPIWIRYVGVEGYGVISFYTMLMTLMHFADAGLAATLTREFAKVEPHRGYKRDFLKTFETIYSLIAVFVFTIVFCLSGFLVDMFLKSDTISKLDLLKCVKIMAVILAVNFMDILYGGGLSGLQKQVTNGLLTIIYGVIRSAVVLLPLSYCPTVQTFLLWQLGAIVLTVILRRYTLIRAIKVDIKPKFNAKYFRNTWRYALGMMLMALISSLNTQLDKLVTGNVLSLKHLGYYALAGTIGAAVGFIGQPITQAVFPELTHLVSLKDKLKLNTLFMLYTYGISTLSSIIGFTLLFYTKDFATIWTGNIETAEAINIPAKLLIMGSILSSIQVPPFYLALAYGHTRTNVQIGVIMLFFMIPSIYLLTKKYGLDATAIPFLFLNIIATIYLGIKLVKRFMADCFYKWWIYSFLPLIVSCVIIFIGYMLIRDTFNSILVKLIFASITALISIAVLYVIGIKFYPEFKQVKIISKFL